jgi:sec-independent protein translocase protein TatB
MLSIPHMIVVFVVVLVVFGPQKLPELARGLGKLMAEFRKASTDFRTAFEEEMRDLERQAREVERKKIAPLELSARTQPETLGTSPADASAKTSSESQSESQHVEVSSPGPVIASVAESVPRSSEDISQEKTGDLSPSVSSEASHDHQQPA